MRLRSFIPLAWITVSAACAASTAATPPVAPAPATGTAPAHLPECPPLTIRGDGSFVPAGAASEGADIRTAVRSGLAEIGACVDAAFARHELDGSRKRMTFGWSIARSGVPERVCFYAERSSEVPASLVDCMGAVLASRRYPTHPADAGFVNVVYPFDVGVASPSAPPAPPASSADLPPGSSTAP